LHGLLIAAAVLVGVPWPIKVSVALGVVLHGFVRRPAAAPETIAVAADGACLVPAAGGSWHRPGPGTRLAPWWIRIDLPTAAARLDILLLADQFERDDWARLSARVRRAPRASRGGSGAGGLDLR